jgi:DNA-binding MarR family transcriptional regulator
MFIGKINIMASIDQEIKSKFHSFQQKAMLNIVYTGNWLSHRHSILLKNYDLSPQQYNILRILKGHQGRLSMNEIKCRMLDKTPNVTRLSDKLSDKGWIVRTKCDMDRRINYVEITEEGKLVLQTIQGHWRELKQPESFLSDEESEHLSFLLDELRSRFQIYMLQHRDSGEIVDLTDVTI